MLPWLPFSARSWAIEIDERPDATNARSNQRAMTETRLLSRIVRGLSQSRDAGVETMLRKGVALLRAGAAARVHLRNCDAVGPGARVVGTPMIENRGRIVIGGGFIARSTYSPVELATGPNGLIEIGEAVWVNFGTAIHAE